MTQGKLQEKIKWLEANPEKDAGRLISRLTASAVLEIVEATKHSFLEIFPKEELGGTLQDYIKTLEDLIKVEAEMGKINRDDKRKLDVLHWFLEQFGR